jgi:hypothetical protein
MWGLSHWDGDLEDMVVPVPADTEVMDLTSTGRLESSTAGPATGSVPGLAAGVPARHPVATSAPVSVGATVPSASAAVALGAGKVRAVGTGAGVLGDAASPCTAATPAPERGGSGAGGPRGWEGARAGEAPVVPGDREEEGVAAVVAGTHGMLLQARVHLEAAAAGEAPLARLAAVHAQCARAEAALALAMASSLEAEMLNGGAGQ